MGTLTSGVKAKIEGWLGAGTAEKISVVLEATPILLSGPTATTVYSSAVHGYRKVTSNKRSDPRLGLPSFSISVLNSSFGQQLEDGSVLLDQFKIGDLELGEFTISNADGEFDFWVTDYGWGDAEATLKIGGRDDAYTAFEAFFPFKVAGEPTFTMGPGASNQIVFGIKSALLNMNLPAQATTFAGTGTLEGGAEHKGKTKPFLLGIKRNITPILVDHANLKWVFSDAVDGAQAISAGYEAGLTIGSLLTADLANGAFTLGNSPTGAVTIDAQGEKFDSGSYSGLLGKIIKELLDRWGVTAINSSDITTFDTAGDVGGIYVPPDSGMTRRAALEEMLGGRGILFPDQDGSEFRLKLVSNPGGESASETYDWDLGEIESIERIPYSPPVWSVRVCYQTLGTVLSEIKATDAGEISRLSQACQYAVAEDATVKNKYPNALRLTVASPLDDSTDAATEAAAILALYKVKRDVLRVNLSRKLFHSWVGDYIQIKAPRYGLDSGKNFLVTGVNMALDPLSCTLECWG